MKRYLFFVNQPYSYAVLRPLQDEIRARGDEAAWFFNGCPTDRLKPDEMQLTTVEAVKRYRPIAVFAPGPWVPHFFPGLKVHVFHGFSINKRGSGTEETSTHYRIRGLFDLYCTQGGKDTVMFQKLADRDGSFSVVKTGWPKLDTLFSADYDARARLGLPKDLPIVLYASTFSRAITSAPQLVDTISQLARDSGWHFLVTLHPKMDSKTVAAYRQMQSEHLSFYESDLEVLPLLKAADAMLCDTSSIMFEFMMLDKPVVTYRTRMPGDYLINVNDAARIQPALGKALTRPPTLMAAARRFCRELHEFSDGRSSARVLDAVDDHIENHARQLRAKPLNLIRKLKIRKKMAYYRFW